MITSTATTTTAANADANAPDQVKVEVVEVEVEEEAQAPLDLASVAPLNTSFFSASGLVQVAISMASLLSSPNAFGQHYTTTCISQRADFPRFAVAHAALVAMLGLDADDVDGVKFQSVPQSKRLELKQLLLEDITEIMDVAQKQIAAPKHFEGTPLPCDIALCKKSLDALGEDAEDQLKALKSRILAIERAREKVCEMELNRGAAALLQRSVAAFTIMPKLSVAEYDEKEEERAAKRIKTGGL